MEVLRLSPSAVNEYENCPQLYKYRKIDRLPETASIDAVRGVLIHSVLHDLFDFPATERTLSSAENLLQNIWAKQVLEDQGLLELNINQKEWIDRARSLLATYFRLEDPTKFEATYRELHLENDFKQNIYLHGYIDRLDIAPTGQVRIIDYKTGKAPKPGWESKAFFQLRVYAYLYWKTHGTIPDLLQLIFLGDEKVVKNSPTLEDMLSTEKILVRVGQDIFISMERKFWPPKPSKLCDWCYFKNICPAHIS